MTVRQTTSGQAWIETARASARASFGRLVAHPDYPGLLTMVSTRTSPAVASLVSLDQGTLFAAPVFAGPLFAGPLFPRADISRPNAYTVQRTLTGTGRLIFVGHTGTVL